jgi:hypothetical protein
MIEKEDLDKYLIFPGQLEIALKVIEEFEND